MRKIRLILIPVLLSIGGLGLNAVDSNLLKNGDFIMNPSRNDLFPWIVSAADRFIVIHNGVRALAMASHSRNKKYRVSLAQMISRISPGTYLLSGEIDGDFTHLLAILGLFPKVSPNILIGKMNYSPAEGKWKKFQCVFKVPEGCTSAQLVLETLTRHEGEVIMIKSIVLEKGDNSKIK